MSELNFFHQEMLSFLKSNANSNDAQQLQDVVENYHQLIGEHPNWVHLERQWINSFSEKEFAQVGLSSYFPKIYRGLPRVYDRTNPSHSRIDKNFTNLLSLKKRSIEKAIHSLYEELISPPKMKISIFTWVMPDGQGDWIAAESTANILKAKWPHLDIRFFFLSRSPLPCPNDFPITYISYEKTPTLANISQEVKLALRESDLILQIPTFFSGTEELFAQICNLPSKKPIPILKNIGEYGFVRSSWFHPKTHNHSMGLHALEKGVFVRKTNTTTFAAIEHKQLLEWVFGTFVPGPDQIDQYRQKHRFHLAYLATAIGGAIYLHSLLKMREKDPLDIDLCCPDLKWLIQWMEMRNNQNLPLLQENFGIQAIEIYALGEKHRQVLQEKGKILRIFNPQGLSHRDMQKLFILGDEWVAVRGNQSFSEAISCGRMFFYDGRDHNRYFLKDILALAKNRLSGHSSTLEALRMMGQANLWNLSDETGDWVDDSYFQKQEKMDWFEIAISLGRALQDGDTPLGFQKFSAIVTEEHSFNTFLCHLIQRTTCHAKHPMIQQMESLQTNLYLHGSISFATLVNNLTKGISHGLGRSY